MQEEIKNETQEELVSNQPFPVEVKEEPQISQKNKNLLIYLIFISVLIGIIGFLGWKYVFGEKIMRGFLPATPTIQATATPTAVVDSTANWKTYKNEKWGFEFKYPSNFIAMDSFGDRISVSNPDRKEIPISGACNGFIFGVIFNGDDLQNRNTRDQAYDFYLGNIKTKRVDAESNLEGFKCVSSDIFIPDEKNQSNNSFHIMLTRDKSFYSDIFDQILSTFKFVEKKNEMMTITANNVCNKIILEGFVEDVDFTCWTAGYPGVPCRIKLNGKWAEVAAVYTQKIKKGINIRLCN